MTTIVRMLAVTALVSMASAAQAQNRLPSERGLEALVKATLLTFNDANVTGNYEVFHAKLSKAFREQYPVERLARRFQEFNKKHIDFDVIAALKPSYDPAPKVDDEGRLLVKGHFPTEPLRVNFDLAFIPSDGEWKLISINVKIDDPK
jgi:hypothetical protein